MRKDSTPIIFVLGYSDSCRDQGWKSFHGLESPIVFHLPIFASRMSFGLHPDRFMPLVRWQFRARLARVRLLDVRESRWPFPAYRGYGASRGSDSSNRTPRPTPQRSLSEGNCDGVNMILGG